MQPTPVSAPQAPVAPQINFPRVTKETVIGFAKAWDMGGIKMILDNTSIQFAMDFANVCMRSYVLDLVNKAQAAKQKAAQAQANPAAPTQAVPEKPKSSLIITDL